MRGSAKRQWNLCIINQRGVLAEGGLLPEISAKAQSG